MRASLPLSGDRETTGLLRNPAQPIELNSLDRSVIVLRDDRSGGPEPRLLPHNVHFVVHFSRVRQRPACHSHAPGASHGEERRRFRAIRRTTGNVSTISPLRSQRSWIIGRIRGFYAVPLACAVDPAESRGSILRILSSFSTLRRFRTGISRSTVIHRVSKAN